MINTYNSTCMMSNEKLQRATIRIFVYAGDKYSDKITVEELEKDTVEVEYTGVTAWDIISGGKEAEEIESNTDESGIDEHHEYLVLHFNNGEQATFRNSHVDMFLR